MDFPVLKKTPLQEDAVLSVYLVERVSLVAQLLFHRSWILVVLCHVRWQFCQFVMKDLQQLPLWTSECSLPQNGCTEACQLHQWLHLCKSTCQWLVWTIITQYISWALRNTKLWSENWWKEQSAVLLMAWPTIYNNIADMCLTSKISMASQHAIRQGIMTNKSMRAIHRLQGQL